MAGLLLDVMVLLDTVICQVHKLILKPEVSPEVYSSESRVNFSLANLANPSLYKNTSRG